METYEPWQHKRFAVLPGMTGWWQITLVVALAMPSLEACIVVPYLCDDPDLSGLPRAVSWPALLEGRTEATPVFRG